MAHRYYKEKSVRKTTTYIWTLEVHMMQARNTFVDTEQVIMIVANESEGTECLNEGLNKRASKRAMQ